MTIPVTMPQLGESVVEGTVARWLKQPGEQVEKLEPLLEISTDKIDTEVPAPASGTLLSILAPAGETVAAGGVLAYIGEPDGSVPQATVENADGRTDASIAPARDPASDAPSGAKRRPQGREFISPVVARIAADQGIALAGVPGTGLGGRITKQDILAYAAKQAERRTASPESGEVVADDETVLQPLTNMRRLIAEHMVRSKRTSPHVTTIMEADLSAVVRHRAANRRTFTERGVALTYTAYFVAATAAALRAVPVANSRFTAAGIELQRAIHIGLAVAIKQGLVAPVLRNADEMSLQGVARAVQDLARRARDGALTPDELQGGTFTVTNHGTGGSLAGTPIINQPQAGILGVGAIVKRPVVRSSSPSLLPSADDAIVIRPMCYLSFTFDHRIMDGAVADQFLSRIRTTLESWR